jgi:hypothetical protein
MSNARNTTTTTGIQLSAFGFADVKDDELGVSINSAMKQIKKLKLNVIYWVFTLNVQTIYYLGKAARNNGMLSKEYLYISELSSIGDVYAQFDDAPEVVHELLRGSLNFRTGVAGITETSFPNQAFESLKKNWAQYQPQDVNRFLPKQTINGSQFIFEKDCFSNPNKSTFSSAASWAYDALAAIGLAGCAAAAQTQNVPRGAVLLNALRDVQFMGLSGLVKFTADGDRDPSTTIYVLNNFVSSPRKGATSLDTIKIGDLPPNASRWSLNEKQTVFRDGTFNIPSDVTVPVEDQNLFPEWAKILAYVEASIIFFLVLLSGIWLKVNAKALVVKQSQPLFMYLILFGIVLLGGSIICLTFEYSDSACMAFCWLFVLGVVFSVAPVTAKTIRVARLWYRRRGFDRNRKNGGFYVLLVVVIALVAVSILLAWQLVAPLEYQHFVVIHDIYDNVISSFGECAAPSDTSVIFLACIVAYLAILVLITAVVSVWVSGAPEKFHEAKWTGNVECC